MQHMQCPLVLIAGEDDTLHSAARKTLVFDNHTLVSLVFN